MAAHQQQEEDFLSEDPEIPSQKVVLLSFLSPEKILNNKDVFLFQQFLKDYEVQWRTSKFEAWFAEQISGLNKKLEGIAGKLDKPAEGPDGTKGPESGAASAAAALCAAAAADIRQNLLRVDTFVEEFQQYTRKNVRELTQTSLQDEYETFLFKNSAKLEEEFFKMNEFRTTIRGIKVRGVYSSEAEASVRAKRLQKSDPNFNVYMGAVGKWMAWEPDPNKVADSEYANEQLNTLMKKYRENEDNREVFYNEQKKSRIGMAKTKATAGVEENETKLTASVVTDTPTLEPSSSTSQGTSYDGLFSGPADLAISRKVEKAAEKVIEKVIESKESKE
uniref:Uncharacterized protein n=1 Tax=viral metagenome TaxID=1070528 RepID=A0A6C0KMA7_9ZZZZ